MQRSQQTHIRIFEQFDQTELLQAQYYQQDFPLHFHDRVCITLVTEGYECTNVHGLSLMAPKGSISLTNADEAHSNPNVNQQDYSFLTYYVSPDVIRYFCQQKTFTFSSRVVQDPALFQLFFQLAQLSHPKEQSFETAIHYLVKHYIKQTGRERANNPGSWKLEEVLAYIQENIESKILIKQLAFIADCSSFQLIRRFKKAKGITPAQYITIKRIEVAKQLLKQGNTVVDTALSVGFFDQSHFSHAFRKFCGMSPAAYQKQIA